MAQIRSGRTKKELARSWKAAQRCFVVVASGFFQRKRKIRTFNVTFAEPYKESATTTKQFWEWEKWIRVEALGIDDLTRLSPRSPLCLLTRLPKKYEEELQVNLYAQFFSSIKPKTDMTMKGKEKTKMILWERKTLFIILQWANGNISEKPADGSSNRATN